MVQCTPIRNIYVLKPDKMLFTRRQFMKEKKNTLYVYVVQKKKKKCDSSSLRFIDNLWGEKIISSFKIKAYNSWNIKLVICYTTKYIF